MDTSTSMILLAVVVTTGKWSQGKGLDIRVVIQAVFLAVMLAVLGESQPAFAKKFGVLILVGAVFYYVPSVLEKTGLSKKSAK